MTAPSSYEKGDVFEEKIFSIIKEMLENELLFLPGKTSKIFRKKKYFSRDRNANIIFDIAIETSMPGSDNFSLLTLIECKNYDVPVGVGDVEEFSSKISQVGEHNTKGIMITMSPYQRSAQNVAISKKIAIAKLNTSDKLEWISRREDAKSYQSNIELLSQQLAGEVDNKSPLIGNDGGFVFTSIQDFLIYNLIIDKYLLSKTHLNIPYKSVEDIQNRINELSLSDCYDHYKLNIERLCQRLSELYEIGFELDQPLMPVKGTDTIGKISYNPLTISVSSTLKSDINRFRFTFCHEVGHLVLHSAILKDYFENSIDTEIMQKSGFVYPDNFSKRLEIQANIFAAQLLMPTFFLNKVVKNYFQAESINKGFIYFDDQPQNMRLTLNLLSQFEELFGVSKEAAKINLKERGLLKDATDTSIGTHIRNTGY